MSTETEATAPHTGDFTEVVERFAATNDEGYNVTVWVARMPAEFYQIESDGLAHPLTTGSSDTMRDLAISIAEAIASGMLGQ